MSRLAQALEPRKEPRAMSDRHLDASRLLQEVGRQLRLATDKHPPMNSAHEGWAVIKEELDELWEHVRADTGRSPEAAGEALHVAAMALRYAVDLCGYAAGRAA